jgi:hypothetical protein
LRAFCDPSQRPQHIADHRSAQVPRENMTPAHMRAQRPLQDCTETSYFADDICIACRTMLAPVTLGTDECEGIHTARTLLMTDFLTLLQRDHHDLETGLDELLQATTLAELRSALDGVRLGLTAHAEAEDIVLHGALLQAGSPRVLEELVGHARSAHLTQEGALAYLLCAKPGTHEWQERAQRLHDLVHGHAAYEEKYVVPAIRELAPTVYESLAGSFATERLRQLAMLQPSAPIFVPELAQAC